MTRRRERTILEAEGCPNGKEPVSKTGTAERPSGFESPSLRQKGGFRLAGSSFLHGSEPRTDDLQTGNRSSAPVAQGIERCPAEAEDAGSNPAGRKAGLELRPALEGAAEGEFVGGFEIPAHGDSVGKLGHHHSQRLEHPQQVHRGEVAVELGL